MKCVYYFSLLLVFFLFSCNNTDKVIETTWNDFENEQYVSAMEKFSGIAKKYKNDWNKGYSQECQVLRYYRKNFAGTVFNRNQSIVRFVVYT